MKTTMLGADGRSVTTFVLDLKTDTVIHADYDGGQYVTGPVPEYLQLMLWLRQKAKDTGSSTGATRPRSTS